MMDVVARREAMRAIGIRNARIARNERDARKRNAWAGTMIDDE